MANKSLFSRTVAAPVAPTTTINNAGGNAYKFEPKHALAQYALTGCLNNTYYITAEAQLSKVLELCNKVDATFIAKTAIYARKQGHMKDMPALLVGVLAVLSKGKHFDNKIFEVAFKRVIDNPKMVRNFIQMIRSTLKVESLSRRSLGSLPKRLLQEYIQDMTEEQLLNFSVGNDPSIKDMFKLVHPRPKDKKRENFHAYLMDYKKHVVEKDLPKIVRDFEAFKRGDISTPPDVNFQLLTSLELTNDNWIKIAKDAHWQMTRMNLNTFNRHGVFGDKKMVKMIADRLRDKDQIRKSRVFPYQLLAAYLNAKDIPTEVKEALQDAMEISVGNVPSYGQKVYVFPDVSGSMSSPITGNRGSSTTSMRCIDIAGLVAAAILRNNKDAEVIPFEDKIIKRDLNPRDSVMTNANILAGLGGGGTNCSAPLAELNRRKANGDLIIYVSDCESWVDSNYSYGNGTETMKQWKEFKSRNHDAKMVCIDIQANESSQMNNRPDVLNVGGFSDKVFDIINSFVHDELDGGHLVGEIDKVQLT